MTSSNNMNVCVVGYGYWGPNIVRNISMHPKCNVLSIVEVDPERSAVAKRACPTAEITDDLDSALKNPTLDAVAICTPVRMHFEMAKQALEAGKHVLVEKPMVTSVEEAEQLFALASENGLVIKVDYTFLYTGAVRKVHSLFKSGELGKLRYIDSTRINLGIYQQDVNVIWDLAIHDLSIIFHLVNERPSSVRTTGSINELTGVADIAYISLHYDSGLFVHLNCSWASPVKIRHMIFGGSDKMIIYDDIQPSDKLKVYEYSRSISSGEERRKVLVDYRLGEVRIPKFALTEALAVMIDDFYTTVKTEMVAPNSKMTLDIVKTLVKADESLASGGKLITL